MSNNEFRDISNETTTTRGPKISEDRHFAIKAEERSKPKHMELYRVKLECKIARDACEGKNVPQFTNRMDWAIYNLAHAIEDIANHLEKVAK